MADLKESNGVSSECWERKERSKKECRESEGESSSPGWNESSSPSKVQPARLISAFPSPRDDPSFLGAEDERQVQKRDSERIRRRWIDASSGESSGDGGGNCQW